MRNQSNTPTPGRSGRGTGSSTGLSGESRSYGDDKKEERDAERHRSSSEDNVYPWARCTNDIDAYLWMCGAYCHSPRRAAFCRRFGLNSKRMREVYLLANQLATLLLPALKQQPTACSESPVGQTERARSAQKMRRLKSTVRAADAWVAVPLKPAPPTPAMRLALHACVIEGFIDHVAVWVEEETRSDLTGAQAPATNYKPCRGGYRSAELKNAPSGRPQLAHIHPDSCLARHR